MGCQHPYCRIHSFSHLFTKYWLSTHCGPGDITNWLGLVLISCSLWFFPARLLRGLGIIHIYHQAHDTLWMLKKCYCHGGQDSCKGTMTRPGYWTCGYEAEARILGHWPLRDVLQRGIDNESSALLHWCAWGQGWLENFREQGKGLAIGKEKYGNHVVIGERFSLTAGNK